MCEHFTQMKTLTSTEEAQSFYLMLMVLIFYLFCIYEDSKVQIKASSTVKLLTMTIKNDSNLGHIVHSLVSFGQSHYFLVNLRTLNLPLKPPQVVLK